jgi:hypothetical protein
MHTISWLESLKERDHSEDLEVDGKVITEWILGKQGEKVLTGFILLMIATSEHEASGCMKGGKCLD